MFHSVINTLIINFSKILFFNVQISNLINDLALNYMEHIMKENSEELSNSSWKHYFLHLEFIFEFRKRRKVLHLNCKFFIYLFLFAVLPLFCNDTVNTYFTLVFYNFLTLNISVSETK